MAILRRPRAFRRRNLGGLAAPETPGRLTLNIKNARSDVRVALFRYKRFNHSDSL
jgi:hypothetical protein